MEQQNIKLNKFKFDATPYIIAANSFSKQFKKQENKSSDHALSKLDATISENLKECSNIQEDMKIIRAENVNTQQKLDILKWEEKQQSQCGFDLKEALKCMCRNTFVQDNEKCAALARIMQERLGFKLKLMPCKDNPQQWTAKFLFDRSEDSHFVTLTYNIDDESFKLYDMKPKPNRFLDMRNLLEETNDITGLLYLCWKSFMSYR